MSSIGISIARMVVNAVKEVVFLRSLNPILKWMIGVSISVPWFRVKLSAEENEKINFLAIENVVVACV